MLGDITKQLQAMADAADRLAKQPKLTIEIRGTGGGGFSADDMRRNSPQTDAVINELRRRGLVGR